MYKFKFTGYQIFDSVHSQFHS